MEVYIYSKTIIFIILQLIDVKRKHVTKCTGVKNFKKCLQIVYANIGSIKHKQSISVLVFSFSQFIV